MRLVGAKRMRDRLAHHSKNVEIPIVWSTVQNDLPSLRVSGVTALAEIQTSTGTKGSEE
jgi:uncharacterized protein with HEPN domain